MIQVGNVVQYFTSRTFENGVRLKTPEPIGPLAAMVIDVVAHDRVSLVVWMPQGRMYPAFNVTTHPTTPVRHYWRRVPSAPDPIDNLIAELLPKEDSDV